MKVCKCGGTDFGKSRKAKDGLASSCKKCANARWRKYASTAKGKAAKARADKRYVDKNRSKVKARMSLFYRRKKYGVTAEQLERMLAQQYRSCAICRKPFGVGLFYVDHDHASGEVRGLLCRKCNMGLGKMCDDVDLLIEAVVYLLGAK
jgi:hypothetical protein